jgi:arsenite/tail-anchored protein-transporting ATPase
MLRELLTVGSRWTLVGGKGGVGKTTTAAALAVEMAEAGERVLILSVDPAHSLGDALGQRLGPEPIAVEGVPRLEAMEVSAEHERERFLASNRGQLLRLIERGTYLDEADAAGFVDLALPGMDELAALLRLLALVHGSDRRVVLDTAPTGHTLRLLELPSLARGWLAALQAMEEKHQAVSGAFTGAVRIDDVSDMLATFDRELAALETLLRDPDRTRFLLVSTAEPVVLAETERFRQSLQRLGIALAGRVVNRAAGGEERAPAEGTIRIPPLGQDLRGVAGLRSFAEAASLRPGVFAVKAGEESGLRVGRRFDPPFDRTVYLVGGKGGVGKSTVAAALAIRVAEQRSGGVLLLGTDPAGSLGDVLGMRVEGAPGPVEGAPSLHVQELDAAKVWAEFRDGYRNEAERLFQGLLGGLSAAADQRVLERLIDLAPPGLDELMALLEVLELLEEGTYGTLVIDTAPTGHLLRLLEMPEVALQWTHTLLRLLLKYREVIGLGQLAERVLRLARSLRSLLAVLTDPQRSWLLLVALPESLSVPETRRMTERLSAMAIPVGGLLINRLLTAEHVSGDERLATELTRLAPGAHAAAPLLERGPVGVAELKNFSDAWRLLERTADAP